MANGNTMPSSSYSMLWRWLLAVVVVLLLAGATLVTSAYYTGWPKSFDFFDKGLETPPTLEVSDTALQGFMKGGSKGFSKFDDSDKNKFKEKFGGETCPTAKHPVAVKSHMHYYTVIDETTFGEAFASLEPVADKQIFIAYYDAENGKYLGYPEQTRYKLVKDGREILKMVAPETKIPAYTTLVIISEADTKLCGKAVVTEDYMLENNPENEIRIQSMITDMAAKNVSYSSGWVMMPFGMNKGLLAEMIPALGDSLDSVWVWDGSEWKELVVTQYDASGVAVIADSAMGVNNVVWFELNSDVSIKALLEAGDDEGDGEPPVAACSPACVTGERCFSVKGAAAECLTQTEADRVAADLCKTGEDPVVDRTSTPGVWEITGCSGGGAVAGDLCSRDVPCGTGNTCVKIGNTSTACVNTAKLGRLCETGETQTTGTAVNGVVPVTCVAADAGDDVGDGVGSGGSNTCAKAADCDTGNSCVSAAGGVTCVADTEVRTKERTCILSDKIWKADANGVFQCVNKEIPPDITACSSAAPCAAGSNCVLKSGETSPVCVATADARNFSLACGTSGKVWMPVSTNPYASYCSGMDLPKVVQAVVSSDGGLVFQFEKSVLPDGYDLSGVGTTVSGCLKAEGSDACAENTNFSNLEVTAVGTTDGLLVEGLLGVKVPSDVDVLVRVDSLGYVVSGGSGEAASPDFVLPLRENNVAVVKAELPAAVSTVHLTAASVSADNTKMTFTFDEPVWATGKTVSEIAVGMSAGGTCFSTSKIFNTVVVHATDDKKMLIGLPSGFVFGNTQVMDSDCGNGSKITYSDGSSVIIDTGAGVTLTQVAAAEEPARLVSVSVESIADGQRKFTLTFDKSITGGGFSRLGLALGGPDGAKVVKEVGDLASGVTFSDSGITVSFSTGATLAVGTYDVLGASASYGSDSVKIVPVSPLTLEVGALLK